MAGRPFTNDFQNGGSDYQNGGSAYQQNGGMYFPERTKSGESDGSSRNEPITVDSTDGIPLIKHDEYENATRLDCGYCHRFRGMIFSITSALFFSFQALLVAKIRHVHFAQITFFRMFVQALFITPIVIIKKKSFIGPKEERLKLFFRAIFGTVSMGGMYYAIQNMPLGEASVIRFSCPAFVGIIAFFVLKESCGIFEFLIILLTMSGVVLIAQPPFVFGEMHREVVIDTNNSYDLFESKFVTNSSTMSPNNISTKSEPMLNLSAILSDVKPKQVILTSIDPEMTMEGRLLGSATALIAAIAGSGVHILLRQLRTVDASTVIFTYSIIGAIISGFVTTCVSGWTFSMSWQTWFEQFGVGVFAVIAQLCFTWALQEENAGTVSVLRTTEIIFAFIYQTALLHLYPNLFSIFGAVLISGSAVAHGVRKWYVTREEFVNLDEQK